MNGLIQADSPGLLYLYIKCVKKTIPIYKETNL